MLAMVAVFDGGDFNVEIDSLEGRAGEALAITRDLERAAAAFAFQVAKVSAGTRFIAATNMNSQGNVTLPATREMASLTPLVRPSAIGGNR